MKKFFQFLMAVAAIAIAAVIGTSIMPVQNAHAQAVQASAPQSLSPTMPSFNGLTATNGVMPTNVGYVLFTNGNFIDCSLQRFMVVNFNVIGGTATSNETFCLVPSVGDGSFDSNHVFVITIGETGGTPGTNYATNIDAGGYLGMYLVLGSNQANAQTTNTWKYGVKPKAL